MNAHETSHDDQPELANANSRLGLQLFAVYLVLYLGFVLGSAFAPGFMASTPFGESAFAPGDIAYTPFGGLNVAVLYGMALILAAFLLAIVYVVLCGRAGRRFATANTLDPKGAGR